MTPFGIFRECFPRYRFDEDTFTGLAGLRSAEIFTAARGGDTVGFAAVKGGDLRLLCVLPEFQGQGIGAELLSRAEEFVRAQGHDELNAGGCGSGLFIGATPESAGFFEKHGYAFGEKIAEMGGDADKLTSAPYPEGAAFGFFGGDGEILKKAVRAVEDDWAQYFDGCEVFCGYADGEIASFCIVGDDETCLLSDGKSKIGSIGCVGTVPKFRRRGIGLKTVSLAAEELTRRGCDKIFIHYTGVYDWYAKLGFETFQWVRLGSKKLM